MWWQNLVQMNFEGAFTSWTSVSVDILPFLFFFWLNAAPAATLSPFPSDADSSAVIQTPSGLTCSSMLWTSAIRSSSLRFVASACSPDTATVSLTSCAVMLSFNTLGDTIKISSLSLFRPHPACPAHWTRVQNDGGRPHKTRCLIFCMSHHWNIQKTIPLIIEREHTLLTASVQNKMHIAPFLSNDPSSCFHFLPA